MIYLIARDGIRHASASRAPEAPRGDAAFLKPLIDAAVVQAIDLVVMADSAAPWPMRLLRQSARPIAVLIGDDPGPIEGAGGPEAWRCADRIGDWCRAAVVHASGAKPYHYAVVLDATMETGRAVVVETVSMHWEAWTECIDCPSTLLIVPKDGIHPVVHRVLH